MKRLSIIVAIIIFSAPVSFAQEYVDYCQANPASVSCNPDNLRHYCEKNPDAKSCDPAELRPYCVKNPGAISCKTQNLGDVTTKPSMENNQGADNTVNQAKGFVDSLLEGAPSPEATPVEKKPCDKGRISYLQSQIKRLKAFENESEFKLLEARAEFARHPEWAESEARYAQIQAEIISLELDVSILRSKKTSTTDTVLGSLLGGFYTSTEEEVNEGLKVLGSRIAMRQQTLNALNEQQIAEGILQNQNARLSLVSDISGARSQIVKKGRELTRERENCD